MEVKKFKIGECTFTVVVKAVSSDALTLEITDESSGLRQVVVAASVVVRSPQKCFVFRLNQHIYKVIVLGDTAEQSRFFSFAHGLEVEVERLSVPSDAGVVVSGYTPAYACLATASDHEYREVVTSKQQDDESFICPLAGRVVKVLVVEGQAVEQHQPLVVVESMKMENELCAPFAGFIKTLSISDGNVVKPNQVLLRLERKQGGGDVAAQGVGK